MWLAALRDRTLLEQTVADVVGLRDQSARSSRAVVVGHLRDKQLVLDNCEHLVDRCAGLAADLLPVAPGLRILARTAVTNVGAQDASRTAAAGSQRGAGRVNKAACPDLLSVDVDLMGVRGRGQIRGAACYWYSCGDDQLRGPAA